MNHTVRIVLSFGLPIVGGIVAYRVLAIAGLNHDWRLILTALAVAALSAGAVQGEANARVFEKIHPLTAAATVFLGGLVCMALSIVIAEGTLF